MKARYVELVEGVSPEPGDLFHKQDHAAEAPCPHDWASCDGRHLHSVLPNGEAWEVTARAPGCPQPKDGAHRCYVVSGTPPRLTVSSVGPSCGAGERSIEAKGWRGYLWDGFWHRVE